MKKMLTSAWMIVVISAVVYFGATVAFWKTPVRARQPVAQDATAAAAAAAKFGPSWEFTNPEADQLMSDLKTEKAALAKKEKDLNDLGARLQAERTELDTVAQNVKQMQADFDQNVVRIKDEEVANLKKLAKVYADMAPDSAATILAQMDDAAIVKIMVYMKEAETAAVFESMSKKNDAQAKRTANLSERLRLAEFRNATPTPK
jgi:flagellar motility protein MotE (MotC chaperone)